MNAPPAPCRFLVVAMALALSVSCAIPRQAGRASGAAMPGQTVSRQQPFVPRAFPLVSDGRWIGRGLAYGPHRDGQYPGGPSPTRSELVQDLQLIASHWKLIRVYDSVGPTETILEITRENRLDIKVMLGVWIGVEERRDAGGAVLEQFPEVRAANRRAIEAAIRLTGAFPDVVLAVSVGNETQVSWSAHRSPLAIVVDYVREVRSRVNVPVTVADDFNFWNKPESQALAQEVDFLVVHAHPLWNGIQLEDALAWTRQTLADVQALHPGQLLVLGEVGWATQKHNEGEQATLIRGEPGEKPQQVFHDQLTAWVEQEQFPTFFFEAFDENWKGGDHPAEVEKNWGLFRADRTPKSAMLPKP